MKASWLSPPTRDDVHRRWSRAMASWRSKQRKAGRVHDLLLLLIVVVNYCRRLELRGTPAGYATRFSPVIDHIG